MSTYHSQKGIKSDPALLKDHNGKTITDRSPVPLGSIHSLSDLYSPIGASEETLVVDIRGTMRPAQLVETKILSILRNDLMPFSHLRLRSHGHTREHC
jgi:hypothetical protein